MAEARQGVLERVRRHQRLHVDSDFLAWVLEESLDLKPKLQNLQPNVFNFGFG